MTNYQPFYKIRERLTPGGGGGSVYPTLLLKYTLILVQGDVKIIRDVKILYKALNEKFYEPVKCGNFYIVSEYWTVNFTGMV